MKTLKSLLTIPLLISGAVLISSCAPSNGSGVLPSGGATMSNIYNSQFDNISINDNSIDGVRNKIRESYSNKNTDSKSNAYYQPVSNAEPHTLLNPLIKIYVYPHFDGNDQNYIPGHYGYTKLYSKTHFALPGEV